MEGVSIANPDFYGMNQNVLCLIKLTFQFVGFFGPKFGARGRFLESEKSHKTAFKSSTANHLNQMESQ